MFLGYELEVPLPSGEAYLLSKGWDHVMTEEDGCDTWSFPWELRATHWPIFLTDRRISSIANQHFWDLKEAVELQKALDGWKRA